MLFPLIFERIKYCDVHRALVVGLQLSVQLEPPTTKALCTSQYFILSNINGKSIF
jgi:hypothetical protein